MVGRIKEFIKRCVYEAVAEYMESQKEKELPEALKEEPEEVSFGSAVLAEWIYGKEES